MSDAKISDAALPVVARYVGRTSNIYRYIAEDLAVVDAQIADEAKKPEAVRLRDELRERAEFEASYQSLDMTRDGQGYSASDTNYTWSVWQAALAATGKQQVGEAHPDDLAVDAFAYAMKQKMADARAKGRGGWEDPAQCSAVDLTRLLRDHVEKGDPRDVANFCMMLHQRGESIVAYLDLPYMSEDEVQQVGEVQGDAISTSEGARRYVAEFFTRELRRHDFGRYITTTLAADFACALAQHLAARQPVGDGWSGWATQKPGHMPKLWGTREIAELNHDLTGDARLIFLSEQTAQVVDLGQLRELSREMDSFRTKWKTVSIREFNHYADRLLALIEEAVQ